MVLYHTGDKVIKRPDIHYGRKNADFGQGFYLTPDKEFTYRWAQKNAVVNIYDLDETDLNIHRFSRDQEWFTYIFNNRRVKDGLDVDVVMGPIANDTIFDTLGVITSGYLSPEEATKLLLIGPEYTQVAIKTEKAISQLHWRESVTIERMDDAQQKKEQEIYQMQFAAEMERLVGNES